MKSNHRKRLPVSKPAFEDRTSASPRKTEVPSVKQRIQSADSGFPTFEFPDDQPPGRLSQDANPATKRSSSTKRSPSMKRSPSKQRSPSTQGPSTRRKMATQGSATTPGSAQSQPGSGPTDSIQSSPSGAGILLAIPYAKSGDGIPVEIEVEPDERRPFELGDILTREFAARNSSILVSFAFHILMMLLLSLVLIHSTGKAMIMLTSTVRRTSKSTMVWSPKST